MKTLTEKVAEMSPAGQRPSRTGADEPIAGELTLYQLRELLGVTPEEMVDRLGIAPEDVFRLECHEDVGLSALRGHVEALGGELHVSARFPDRSPVELTGPASLGPRIACGSTGPASAALEPASRGVATELEVLFASSPGVVGSCAPRLARRIEAGEHDRALEAWIVSLAASIETVPPSLAAAARWLARHTGLDDEVVAATLAPHVLDLVVSEPHDAMSVVLERTDVDIIVRAFVLALQRWEVQELWWIGRLGVIRQLLERLQAISTNPGRLVLLQEGGRSREQDRDLLCDTLEAAAALPGCPVDLGIADFPAELGVPHSHVLGLRERVAGVLGFQGGPPLILDVAGIDEVPATGSAIDLGRSELDALVALVEARTPPQTLVHALRRVAGRAVRASRGTEEVVLERTDLDAALDRVADHVEGPGKSMARRRAWAPIADALARPRTRIVESAD